MTLEIESNARPSIWSDLARAAVPIVAIVCAVGFFFLFGSPPETPQQEPPPPPPLMVETAVAAPYDAGVEIVVDGVAAVPRTVTVAAEVAGRITYKNPACNEGRVVREGDVLYEIDPTDYELAIKRIKGEVRQAQAALDEIGVQRNNTQSLVDLASRDVDLAQRELDRIQGLSNSRISTATERDQAERAVLTAQNAKQTLTNQLLLLDVQEQKLAAALDLQSAQLEAAEVDLKRTKVFAPVSGVIVQDSVELDGYVQPGTNVAAITDGATMEVHCNLEIDDVFWLLQEAAKDRDNLGPLAAVQIPRVPVVVEYHYAGYVIAWDGVLDRYNGRGVDEATRTVACRVLVEHPNSGRVVKSAQRSESPAAPALVNGMFVTVRASIPSDEPLLKIPNTALHPRDVVWKAVDGKLERSDASVARKLEDFSLVYAGAGSLNAGDVVITSPIPAPQIGQPVQTSAEVHVEETVVGTRKDSAGDQQGESGEKKRIETAAGKDLTAA